MPARSGPESSTTVDISPPVGEELVSSRNPSTFNQHTGGDELLPYGKRIRFRLLMGACVVAALLAADQSAALAHMETPVTPENVWRSWNLDPLILVSIAVLVYLYWSGVRTIWQRAGRGKGVGTTRVAAFASGVLALFVALVSPLDQLGGALFSAHMVQHLLLMLVATPLLVYGATLTTVLVALPRAWRRGIGSVAGRKPARRLLATLGNPFVVWSLQAALLWMWHLPSLYEAALRSAWVHSLEHLTFVAIAGLFWWLVLQPQGRRVLGLGVAVIFIFTTMVQSGALGALITFAPTNWYDAHAPYVGAWNMTPIEDQQLAGLIMWVPAGLIYLAAALTSLTLWFQSMGPAEDTGSSGSRVLDSGTGTDRSHSPRSG